MQVKTVEAGPKPVVAGRGAVLDPEFLIIGVRRRPAHREHNAEQREPRDHDYQHHNA